MTIPIVSDIIISEGNRNPKKNNSEVLKMIDLEKMKSLIKVQWDEYRYSIEKTQQSSVCYDENLYRFYLDRAKTYKCRAQGMEDMLYALGYFVLRFSDGSIDITERIERDD